MDPHGLNSTQFAQRRDVSGDFITSHRKLEEHCTQMYDKLKADRPPTLTPPPT